MLVRQFGPPSGCLFSPPPVVSSLPRSPHAAAPRHRPPPPPSTSPRARLPSCTAPAPDPSRRLALPPPCILSFRRPASATSPRRLARRVVRAGSAASSFSSSPSSLLVPEMDCASSSSLFPLHRCKTVHLVRHAQGIHNVEGEKDHKAYLSPELFDAHLTPLGWQQVDNLRKHVQSRGLAKRIDLVITSPLLRTIQTAVGVFGGEGYSDGVKVAPLMVANAGNSARSAISSLNCPPILAVESCREHLGVHPCDKRRSISEYQLLFPAIDFSLIENDEDVLWKPDIREPNEDVAARGIKFINWLWTRKEKEIAVVTHSGFLYHTLKLFGNDCHPKVKEEISQHFGNCELRSMVLVDRSMLGSDTSTTNYAGKIPPGLDLPSDMEDDPCSDKVQKA